MPIINLLEHSGSEFLISGLRRENPRLYDLFRRLRLTIGTNFEWQARAIIPGTLTVANDVLSHRFKFKMPVDQETGHFIADHVEIYLATLTVKTQGACSLDCLVRRENKTEWGSLFLTGKKPILTASQDSMEIGKFSINDLHNNDELRIDILTADGTAAGFDFVLQGILRVSAKDENLDGAGLTVGL